MFLPPLPNLLFAQVPSAPVEIVRPQEVRPLPGQLDRVPVFNSNSPEKVLNRGILLSTFPPESMARPEAHLNYLFQGRFDLFVHHVFQAMDPENLTSLYLGVLAHNPTDTPVTVRLLAGASYLSQPDAPFIALDSLVPNPQGQVYAGPGSRVMAMVLGDRRQEGFPEQITILPGQYQTLLNVPIPVADLDPPLNGRSTYLKLVSDGPLYLASLADFEPSADRPPTPGQWQDLLFNGNLATPRDRPPSEPGAPGPMIYGRVAGVSQGASWNAQVYDPDSWDLAIPAPGDYVSYGISTLVGGTQGTGQVQTAPMVVRYEDTAYEAHGNYGVLYDVNFPLHNPTSDRHTITIALETPIKKDAIADGLGFFNPLPTATFFRGPVEVSYKNDQGQFQLDNFHLVQKRGQQGDPLVTLTLEPGDRRLVKVRLRYPPDATPPQVLTIHTLTP